MRKDYYKYLVKKLIGIYSSSLLLPLICVLFYIMCMILTNNYSIQFDRFEHIREMTDSLPLYYFVKFVSLVLLGMFIINNFWIYYYRMVIVWRDDFILLH